MSFVIRIIVIALAIASLMIVGMEHNAFANSGSKKFDKGLNTLDNTVLTPPPCVNNTSTSGPWTDYENLIRSLYHCEHIDINVLHESPNSTMIRWYDDKAPPGGVQDKEGELNFHELSHEDNGFMTTVVLVPNP
jgi:hypothetical protein